MRRVSVVGASGSGKSTVARALAERLSVRHLELDALKHQPGWVATPDDELRARVAEELDDADGWVVDGNYSAVRESVVWPAVDTVVWLDLPRALTVSRVVRRSLRRVVFREELWNGNRESWSNLLSRDPLRSIVLWAWTSHGRVRERYGTAMADPRWSDLRFVRLRSRAEVRRFLASVTHAGADDRRRRAT